MDVRSFRFLFVRNLFWSVPYDPNKYYMHYKEVDVKKKVIKGQ